MYRCTHITAHNVDENTNLVAQREGYRTSCARIP